ncbi:MAG: BrnA antitoxin family protein [Alphaproteobacteria bacterium]|nr:BrnA antitoxin family protein [Alphaproteobacteria bacterium]
MKKANSKPLTAAEKKELAALARLPGDKIDTKSIPEVRNWAGGKRGALYRPLKQQLTLRLDADVVAWFRDHAPKGQGYQTDINRALRDHVQRKARKTG